MWQLDNIVYIICDYIHFNCCRVSIGVLCMKYMLSVMTGLVSTFSSYYFSVADIFGFWNNNFGAQ